MNHRKIILIAFWSLLGTTCRSADQPPCKHDINSAQWLPQSEQIDIALTGGPKLDTSQNQAAQWFLVNANSKEYKATAFSRTDVSYTSQTVRLSAKGLVQPKSFYFVYATGVVFTDCAKPMEKLGPHDLTADGKPNPAFTIKPATNRDSSDFYFAPTVDGASGTGASYTLDSKVQFKYALAAPLFGSGVRYRPAIFFIPGIDAKISSNAKEDGNSVLLQAPFEIIAIVDPDRFPRLSKVIPSVISQPGFVTEADKKFHDINGIFSDTEYIVVRSLGNDWLSIVPEPLVGVETGANIKAQQVNTYPSAILRADVGMHVGINFFKVKKPKPLFSLESDYIRRMFLNPEPNYKTDTKGNYVLESVGTQPRDHASVKLGYNLTDYISLTVAYENGRLPPVFTKVSDKYTFGITFNGQWMYKPPK
jgi:hypothetical protein